MLDENELGYHAEGEPTTAQMCLQDDIDNAIHAFCIEIQDIYHLSATNQPEPEWDISKISEIRMMVEDLFELPDRY